MAGQAPAGLGEARLPAGAGADAGGLVEQAVGFFLLSQAGEPGVQGMVEQQEGFLAVEDRRIGAGENGDWLRVCEAPVPFLGGVVEAVQFPRARGQPDRPQERRVRVALEFGYTR